MRDIKLKFWIKLMYLGSKFGCHQRYDRSFIFFGYQLPLCARCTGLVLGVFSGLLSLTFIRIKLIESEFITVFLCFVIAIMVIGIDGIGQLKGKWVSTNFRRIITGFFCSFYFVLFVAKICIDYVVKIL